MDGSSYVVRQLLRKSNSAQGYSYGGYSTRMRSSDDSTTYFCYALLYRLEINEGGETVI